MSTTPKWNVGDLVRLKSGGPVMTVFSTPDHIVAVYTCSWFKANKVEQGDFFPAMLEEVNDEDES